MNYPDNTKMNYPTSIRHENISEDVCLGDQSSYSDGVGPCTSNAQVSVWPVIVIVGIETYILQGSALSRLSEGAFLLCHVQCLWHI